MNLDMARVYPYARHISVASVGLVWGGAGQAVGGGAGQAVASTSFNQWYHICVCTVSMHVYVVQTFESGLQEHEAGGTD